MEDYKTYTTLKIFPRVTEKTYSYFRNINRKLNEPKTYITYWLESPSNKIMRIDIIRMAVKCNIYINCVYYVSLNNCDNFITDTLFIAQKNNLALIVDNYGEHRTFIKDLYGHPTNERDVWLKYATRN